MWARTASRVPKLAIGHILGQRDQIAGCPFSCVSGCFGWCVPTGKGSKPGPTWVKIEFSKSGPGTVWWACRCVFSRLDVLRPIWAGLTVCLQKPQRWAVWDQKRVKSGPKMCCFWLCPGTHRGAGAHVCGPFCGCFGPFGHQQRLDGPKTYQNVPPEQRTRQKDQRVTGNGNDTNINPEVAPKGTKLGQNAPQKCLH